MDYTSKPEN
jgi:hypothetical protein